MHLRARLQHRLKGRAAPQEQPKIPPLALRRDEPPPPEISTVKMLSAATAGAAAKPAASDSSDSEKKNTPPSFHVSQLASANPSPSGPSSWMARFGWPIRNAWNAWTHSDSKAKTAPKPPDPPPEPEPEPEPEPGPPANLSPADDDPPPGSGVIAYRGQPYEGEIEATNRSTCSRISVVSSLSSSPPGSISESNGICSERNTDDAGSHSCGSVTKHGDSPCSDSHRGD